MYIRYKDSFPFVLITLFLSASEQHIHTCTASSAHIFMVTVLHLLSLSLMPWIDIKESLMIKPSAPISPALASIHYVHTTLFEYQAPTASNTTLQTPFFFVSIIGSPDSSRSATGQWVQISWPQALGHFALYRPIGVYDLFWMLPWQLAYSAGVFSRWCFFKHDLTFYFSFYQYLPYRLQYQKGHCLKSFPWTTPCPVHLQSFKHNCFYSDVNRSP